MADSPQRDEDELTVDGAIRCLEMQVGRPPNEKKRVVSAEEGGSTLDWTTSGTPGGMSIVRSLVDAGTATAWEVGVFRSAYAFVGGSGCAAG